MSDSTTIHCTKCKQEYPATTDYFRKDKKKSNGLSSWCKHCANAATREYKNRNWEHVKQVHYQWRVNNPEKWKALQEKYNPPSERWALLQALAVSGFRLCTRCEHIHPLTEQYWHKDKNRPKGFSNICKSCRVDIAARYLADNRETIRERNKASRVKHNEQIKKRKRDQYALNPEPARKQAKRWAKENPIKVRLTHQRRKAQKRNADGFATELDLLNMYEDQAGRCAYCGITLHGVYHVDHIYPLVRGGSNWPDNLAISCAECNLGKQAKTVDEWVKDRGW